jgi:hypothetical protein
MLSSDDLDIDLLRNILETVHHVLILGEKVGISRNASVVLTWRWHGIGVRAMVRSMFHRGSWSMYVGLLVRISGALSLQHASNGHRNSYADVVEECGGLDHIERLQQHQNNKVYELASQILVRFFSEGDEDMVERDPHANNAAFEAQPLPDGGFHF